MASSREEEVATLALSLLEDVEMSKTTVEAMVLKASRLARLIGDETAQSWLWYERYGYNDHEPISTYYLSATSRWIDQAQKKAWFGSIGTQEAALEAHHNELEVTKKFTPSGEYAGLHYAGQTQAAQAANGKIVTTRKIISAVRGQIHEFATRRRPTGDS